MSRSLFVEIQPWVTIRVGNTRDVMQPREYWVDAGAFDEVQFNVDISYAQGINPVLRLETSITDDPYAMTLMKNAADDESEFDGVRLPENAAFIVNRDSASPLRRWVRWVVPRNTVEGGIVTFRITALFKSSG